MGSHDEHVNEPRIKNKGNVRTRNSSGFNTGKGAS